MLYKALIILTACTALAAMAQARSTDWDAQFAAVAVGMAEEKSAASSDVQSLPPRGIFGKSPRADGESSITEARRLALENCRSRGAPDCRIIAATSNGCMAVAQADKSFRHKKERPYRLFYIAFLDDHAHDGLWAAAAGGDFKTYDALRRDYLEAVSARAVAQCERDQPPAANSPAPHAKPMPPLPTPPCASIAAYCALRPGMVRTAGEAANGAPEGVWREGADGDVWACRGDACTKRQ